MSSKPGVCWYTGRDDGAVVNQQICRTQRLQDFLSAILAKIVRHYNAPTFFANTSDERPISPDRIGEKVEYSTKRLQRVA
jgi:hypothetical protein